MPPDVMIKWPPTWHPSRAPACRLASAFQWAVTLWLFHDDDWQLRKADVRGMYGGTGEGRAGRGRRGALLCRSKPAGFLAVQPLPPTPVYIAAVLWLLQVSHTIVQRGPGHHPVCLPHLARPLRPP